MVRTARRDAHQIMAKPSTHQACGQCRRWERSRLLDEIKIEYRDERQDAERGKDHP